MHLCLQIGEILEVIVEHAFRQRDSKAVLNALAQTCKMFQDPALNALWREQESLINLIKYLPDDLIDDKRPAFPSDWHRFDYYAAKVHKVHIGANDEVLLETICALIRQSQHGILLPNLRRLHLNVQWNRDILVNLLSFPLDTLAELALDFTLDYKRICDVLDFFQIATPSLGALRLSTTETLSDAPRLFSSTWQINSLTTFQFNTPGRALAWDDLVVLATLPNLRKAVINIRQDVDKFERSLAGLRTSPFPSLHDLEIQSHQPRDIFRFLSNLIPHQWRSLALRCYEITPFDLSSMNDYLSNAHLEASLHEFTVTDDFEDYSVSVMDLTGRSDTLDLSVLGPLTTFPNLELLRWDCVSNFRGTDDELVNTLRAWPRLRVLALGAVPLPSGFTHRGLERVVRCCPCLEELTVAISATDIADAQYPVSSESRLASLMLGVSQIEDPPRFTRWLFGLFPSLMYTWVGEEYNHQSAWNAVGNGVCSDRQNGGWAVARDGKD